MCSKRHCVLCSSKNIVVFRLEKINGIEFLEARCFDCDYDFLLRIKSLIKQK